MRPQLARDIRHAAKVYDHHVVRLGMHSCILPNCANVTRVHCAHGGEPVCMTCAITAHAVVGYLDQQWWKKPKNFRLARRKSTPTHLVLRDGPLNGESIMRGSKSEAKGGKVASWPTGFLRLVVEHPVSGVSLAVPGTATPAIGGYVFDLTDDSYWWVA